MMLQQDLEPDLASYLVEMLKYIECGFFAQLSGCLRDVNNGRCQNFLTTFLGERLSIPANTLLRSILNLDCQMLSRAKSMASGKVQFSCLFAQVPTFS